MIAIEDVMKGPASGHKPEVVADGKWGSEHRSAVAAAVVAVVAAEVAGLHMAVAAAVVRGAGNIPVAEVAAFLEWPFALEHFGGGDGH